MNKEKKILEKLKDTKPRAVFQKCERCGETGLATPEEAGKKCTNYERCSGEEPRDEIRVIKKLYSMQQIRHIVKRFEEAKE